MFQGAYPYEGSSRSFTIGPPGKSKTYENFDIFYHLMTNILFMNCTVQCSVHCNSQRFGSDFRYYNCFCSFSVEFWDKKILIFLLELIYCLFDYGLDLDSTLVTIRILFLVLTVTKFTRFSMLVLNFFKYTVYLDNLKEHFLFIK